jgi:hypothetical protein
LQQSAGNAEAQVKALIDSLITRKRTTLFFLRCGRNRRADRKSRTAWWLTG